MGNNWFDFKQFRIVQERSAFRVGTDSVLLGAWASFAGRERILDAGAGTGLIALMAAQRSNAVITAIEPDMLSAEEACVNVKASRWCERISVEKITLQEFAESSGNQWELEIQGKQGNKDNHGKQEIQGKQGNKGNQEKQGIQGKQGSKGNQEIQGNQGNLGNQRNQESQASLWSQFDMIVSNPPFFNDSLPNSDRRVSEARHNITLSQADLIEAAMKLLISAGVLSLILPCEEGNAFIAMANGSGFHCNRITRVKPLPSLPAHRLLMEFSKERTPLQSDWLIISDGEHKSYTPEYRELTEDFYLEF